MQLLAIAKTALRRFQASHRPTPTAQQPIAPISLLEHHVRRIAASYDLQLNETEALVASILKAARLNPDTPNHELRNLARRTAKQLAESRIVRPRRSPQATRLLQR